MEEHFDIRPAEHPPTPEPPALEGTEPPPIPEGNPPLKVVIEDDTRFDEEELEDLELPELPMKKPKLTNKEVFAPKVQPVAPEKKPKRKRKPPTPEQLERLAEARKKAFQVKAQKKRERDEMKALQEKVAKKKQEKIEEEILDTLDDDEIPEGIKQARKYKEKKMNEDYRAQRPAPPSLTQEDLRKAIAEGVEIYDTKRKAQKKIKREKQEEVNRHNEVKQKIQRAISVNPWDEFLK